MTAVEPGRVGTLLGSWQLRALLALGCCVSAGSVVAWSQSGAFAVVLLATAGIATVVRPDTHAPAGFLTIVLLTVLIGDPGLSPWAIPAVLGIHATHTLAALAAIVPWDARIEWAALAPTARRFLVVQAASQALVTLALLLSPAG